MVVASAITFWGWFVYENISDPFLASWSALYKTFQSFVLNVGFDTAPVPLLLQIGVFLAPFSLGSSLVFLVLSKAYYRLLGILVLLFWRNHVIIAGNTPEAQALFQNQSIDETVVYAVNPQDTIPRDIEKIKNVVVLKGNLFHVRFWRRLGIKYAKSVLIFTGDPLDITDQARMITEAAKNRSRIIPVAFSSGTVGANRNSAEFPSLFFRDFEEGSLVDFSTFSLEEQSAATVAETCAPHNYLDIEMLRKESPRLLVYGFNSLTAESILHFAHLYHYNSHSRTSICVISTNKELFLDFIERNPGLKKVVEIVFIHGTEIAEDLHFCQADFLPWKPHALLIFPESGWDIPTQVRTWRRYFFRRYADLSRKLALFVVLPARGKHSDLFAEYTQVLSGHNVQLLIPEKILSLRHLLDSGQVIDGIAEQIHEAYRERFGGTPWYLLTDREKDFNRRSARHLKIKLRILGYELSSDMGLPDISVPELSSAMIHELSQLEHTRWMSEKYLDGYIFGEKPQDSTLASYCKNALRLHWDLVPYEQLDATDIKKDEQTFEDLKMILAKVLDRRRLRIIARGENQEGSM